MAASYYVMQMFKRRSHGQSEVFSKISKDARKICRACMKKGKIPIFSNKTDLIAALRTFGDVDIDPNDRLPKYLCRTCYDALRTSMKFRETVQRSDKLLKQQLKRELNKNSYNVNKIDDYYASDDYSQDFSNAAETSNCDQNKKLDTVVKVEPELGENSRQSHCRIRKPIDRIPCEVCKKPINKYYYKTHLSFVHGTGPKLPKPKPAKKLSPDDTEPKFVCYVCGKSFRYQSGYSTHILTHQNNFPFECPHCPYKGRYSGLLKIHLRTHTRDYKYQCTECVARFLTSSNLNKHMLIHKERQFKCDACTRAFHKKKQLEEHVQVNHLGVKNHICNICHKAFGYRRQMNKHQLYAHKREKMRAGIMPSYLVAQKSQEEENPE